MHISVLHLYIGNMATANDNMLKSRFRPNTKHAIVSTAININIYMGCGLPNFTSPVFLVKVHSEKAPILFEVLVTGGLPVRCASQFQNCIKRFHSEVAVSK